MIPRSANCKLTERVLRMRVTCVPPGRAGDASKYAPEEDRPSEHAERQATRTIDFEKSVLPGHGGVDKRSKVRRVMHAIQANAVPLLLGIVLALIWCNVDPASYDRALGTSPNAYVLFGWELLGHKITIHYLINDVFMVFFFGIAAKEVTESCLPGGSLNPPRKALAPLVATAGGCLGPIAVYLGTTRLLWNAGAFDGYMTASSVGGSGNHSGGGGHRQLGASGGGGAPSAPTVLTPLTWAEIEHGWGVPTATDISLAWVVAMQCFPLHHPAIDFLLLLAVADDAIGLVIIAAKYTDPLHPVEPIYLPLLVAVLAAGLVMRTCLRLQHWLWYLLFAGVPSWVTLTLTRLHPALALVFVVPLMPSRPPASKANLMPTLQAFEHSFKAPVDFGLFFFTLANAGVNLRAGGGPLTGGVLAALIAGKVVGVTLLVLLAAKLGCAPLNDAIKSGDVLMVGSVASVGLTVALFVAGEAFPDERLQGQAKLGALLSGLMGLVCVGVARAVHNRRLRRAKRHDNYYRHKVRAGDNQLPAHPDLLAKPALFEVDPDAALRARARWRKTMPMLAREEDGTMGERSAKQIVSFMQRSSSRRSSADRTAGASPATNPNGATITTATHATESCACPAPAAMSLPAVSTTAETDGIETIDIESPPTIAGGSMKSNASQCSA